MMNSKKMNQETFDELCQLVRGLLDDELPNQSRERLVQLLRSSSEARDFYCRYMALHAQLERIYPAPLAETAEVLDGVRKGTGRREPKADKAHPITYSLWNRVPVWVEPQLFLLQ